MLALCAHPAFPVQAGVSLAGALGIHVLALVCTPPVGLPDLFTVVLCTYAAGHFILFLAYFHYRQIWSHRHRD